MAPTSTTTRAVRRRGKMHVCAQAAAAGMRNQRLSKRILQQGTQVSLNHSTLRPHSARASPSHRRLRTGSRRHAGFVRLSPTTCRHCRRGSHSNCRPADRPCVSAHACIAPHAGARDAPLRRTHRHSAGCGRASHCRARRRRLHPVAVTAPK